MAFMLPMLEMCSYAEDSSTKPQPIDIRLLYYYRTDNPINLFRILEKEPIDAGNRIAAMQP